MEVGVSSAKKVLASLLATMILAPAIDCAIQRKRIEEVLQEQEKEIL